ncbi:hypothetical protein SSTU70S_04987 [Stutzerimonas stutzeri]
MVNIDTPSITEISRMPMTNQAQNWVYQRVCSLLERMQNLV